MQHMLISQKEGMHATSHVFNNKKKCN